MAGLRPAFPAGVLAALLLVACSNAASPAPAPDAPLPARAQEPASAQAQEPEDERYLIPMEGEEEGFDQELLDARLAAITPRVALLRGLDWKHEVPAGVRTPAEFVEFAKGAVAEEYEEGELDDMGRSIALFGFVPEDMDLETTMLEMLESMVGGYYDPDTATFYMISTFNSGTMADYIMAHELGHALDDQYFPLNPFLEAAAGNSDQSFAATCVVEGSASAVGNMYLVRGARDGWLEGAMDFSSMLGMLDDIQEVPPYLIITMTLPYTVGNAFLVRETSVMAGMLKAPAADDLVRAFREPPTSSEQILHPEKYWEDESFDPPLAVEAPDRAAELGAGWRSVHDDTLGEIGCAILTMPRVPSALEVSAGGGDWVHEASSGWGGDRYRLYVHDELGAAMEWFTVWDSDRDAEEFEAALQEVAVPRAPLLRSVHREGPRVRVVFASGSALDAATRLASVR